MKILNKSYPVTAIALFLILSIAPTVYAGEDCGFNSVKDRIQRILNEKKYWDQSINDLDVDIKQCKARIRSLYIDIKELKNKEYRKRRVQRAILDAQGYGGDSKEARQQEVEYIKEDYKITKEMILSEKELLNWLNGCSEKAQYERSKLLE